MSLEARVAALESALNVSIWAAHQAAAEAAESAASNAEALDVVWLLLSGTIIFLMQFGFCMLEAGSVTSKNTETIMVKNLGDIAFNSLMWWGVGYSFAFGEGNAFIGYASTGSYFINSFSSSHDWATFFFQLNFVATASTIVSGAVAERAHILSYLIFSTLCAIVLYPPVAHWQWSSTGWASPTHRDGIGLLGGLIDFAGCGAYVSRTLHRSH